MPRRCLRRRPSPIPVLVWVRLTPCAQAGTQRGIGHAAAGRETCRGAADEWRLRDSVPCVQAEYDESAEMLQPVANAEAVPLFLAALRAAGSEERRWGLALWTRLLCGSMVNRSACERCASRFAGWAPVQEDGICHDPDSQGKPVFDTS